MSDLERQDIRDIAFLLGTREGARFLSRLFDMAGVFSISYVPGDDSATIFREGARNIGLAIYADTIEAADDAESKIRRARWERANMENNEEG